jgi:hypothetical protein
MGPPGGVAPHRVLQSKCPIDAIVWCLGDIAGCLRLIRRIHLVLAGLNTPEGGPGKGPKYRSFALPYSFSHTPERPARIKREVAPIPTIQRPKVPDGNRKITRASSFLLSTLARRCLELAAA